MMGYRIITKVILYLFAALKRASEGATLQQVEEEARVEIRVKAEARNALKRAKQAREAELAKRKEKMGKCAPILNVSIFNASN